MAIMMSLSEQNVGPLSLFGLLLRRYEIFFLSCNAHILAHIWFIYLYFFWKIKNLTLTHGKYVNLIKEK